MHTEKERSLVFLGQWKAHKDWGKGLHYHHGVFVQKVL